MGQDQLKDKMEDKRQRLIYCTKNTRQYQLKRGGGIILKGVIGFEGHGDRVCAEAIPMKLEV